MEKLLSQLEGRTFSAADEGAEAARRDVDAKVKELGGWDIVEKDPAALDAVAKLMGGRGLHSSTF